MASRKSVTDDCSLRRGSFTCRYAGRLGSLGVESGSQDGWLCCGNRILALLRPDHL